MEMTLRRAGLEDAEDITRAHLESWRRLPGYRGELYAIYLVEEAKRWGVGRALFQRGTDWLRENGLVPFVLWVLKDNAAARGFYERLGDTLVGEQAIEMGGRAWPEVAYAWEA